ncbi:MAG: phosphoribosylformylglycinamidine cyclo-ligase [Fimbriimonadaceae bacterium]|nr:phosphoribosylformylglycinamidine cyclo-ligase [Fimbriimonadaceae bacterium]QYK57381.1 MAG: phosphoribosylformylglycinamidine cyclo-ligase [Fimbriimonadaceae bacterium]
MAEERLTYANAGVDIEVADRALRTVASAVEATHGPRVLGGIGGFGGMFSASFPDLANPVLVSSIDGVGTKTKVASMVGDWTGIGHDIVNHCVNDVLCQGARPLFFLDYFGCSALSPEVFERVVGGVAAACALAGCALIGGETAEMPGVYLDGEVDLVGCLVGIVDLDRKLPRPKARAGDKLIGLASSGLHTNGFSLARKALFDVGTLSVRDSLPGEDVSLGEALLRPHKSYLHSLGALLDEFPGIFALAHVTGGGIPGNLPRVLPSGLQAEVHRSTWEVPPIFRLIQQAGSVSDDEMFRTFNMGIGMIAVVDQDQARQVVERLNAMGEAAAEIGELRTGSCDVMIV